MKLLVTGFDPFGGEKINPAWEAVKELPDTILDSEVIKLEIPTVFNKSAEVVKEAINNHKPDVVLNIGQAGGRFGITPERVAINMDDARIPDNEGNQPIDEVIQKNGAPAYFTQLPIKAMVEGVKAAGYPASVSNTAGTFVCNHIMYQVQYMIATEFPNVKGGFIHVPYIHEQVVTKASMPSMSISDISKALEATLVKIVELKDQNDLKLVGGAEH
ncbi:pyroglutamyl-peptidase I [Vagococcus sp. PNs007]|uniref:Pyrrolidone-carboxylate peptidase n=1 Tax=Vagococcus proximus TaxID=2991417 RepID=A0ABT5X3C2_9ENTE|nr:pyroglutamyl-peptidase I [Vagococcus proximus]MDF0480409.1 pyroglutamyl-peptidase I [Vagococcus proximus]